jgi:prepilin-type processing-associated H-X9-DG protein
MTIGPGEVLDDRGEPVNNPANGRYPWRVAPYLSYKMLGSVLVNEQTKLAELKDRGSYVYLTSAHPSFGINATFVGGNYRTGLIPSRRMVERYGQFAVTRLGQASKSQMIIVFASARSDGSGADGGDPSAQPGFHLLTPPATIGRHWSATYEEKAPAAEFGHVHPRYDGRAVCAMLDGHVELLDAAQLQDMRHWSDQAAEADEPDWRLTPQ